MAQNGNGIVNGKITHDTFKLIYFEERGKIDLIKLIFKIAQIDFEDVQIKLNEWDFYKTWIPFQQLPALVVNNTIVISHVNVICKYLANKYGLVCSTKNEQDLLLCDMIVEQLRQCELDQVQLFNEIDTLKRVQTYNKFLNETLPCTLSGLDKILSTNSSSKFIIGMKLTWIDLLIVNDFEWLDDVCKKKINFYSNFKIYYEFIRGLTPISDWYSKQKPLHIVKNV